MKDWKEVYLMLWVGRRNLARVLIDVEFSGSQGGEEDPWIAYWESCFAHDEVYNLLTEEEKGEVGEETRWCYDEERRRLG